jgi:uncharacterized protein YjiS (DUF1127 family)
MQQIQCCDATIPITASDFLHLILSVGDGNSASPLGKTKKMQTNQTATFSRTRAAFANSVRSLQTRQQIARELALLSDRALADLGLYRSDIRAFARDASRIPGAESVIAALAADLKALVGFSGAADARASW